MSCCQADDEGSSPREEGRSEGGLCTDSDPNANSCSVRESTAATVAVAAEEEGMEGEARR